MVKHGALVGGTVKPEYKAWAAMMSRCTKPKNKQYKDYGGRGIGVCERWRTAANFLEDMGPRPEGTSLDRIDNEKGYEPGNCRWATNKVQSYNKRTTVMIEHNGKTLTAPEWAEVTGLSEKTIRMRMFKGWTAERTLEQKQRILKPNRLFTYEGSSKTIKDWAAAVGINAQLLRLRINTLGWDTAKALTQPVQVHRQS